jgi:hypothetical protein
MPPRHFIAATPRLILFLLPLMPPIRLPLILPDYAFTLIFAADAATLPAIC